MLDEIGHLGTLEKHLIIQVILLSSHDAQALAAVCSKWGNKNIYPSSPPKKSIRRSILSLEPLEKGLIIYKAVFSQALVASGARVQKLVKNKNIYPQKIIFCSSLSSRVQQIVKKNIYQNKLFMVWFGLTLEPQGPCAVNSSF